MNWEIPDVQAGFRKGRGTRDQIANIYWIIEKETEFQKNIYFCFIDYTKAFDCGSQKTGKFLKRWEYQTTLPASWEICMQVKKQQLEPDMENGLVPNWERSTSSLYIVTLLICRVHHAKCQAGWSTSWNQDCRSEEEKRMGEISITSDMQMTPPLWQKAKRN